jgi:hypothetical protein
MVIIMSRRTFGALLVCGVAALSACDGPAGVELGHDWRGAQLFVLAKVNNLTTVVGINAARHTAEALAVVPGQADDDDVTSPRIVQLADGRWIVSVPKKDRKPSRLYQIDAGSKALDAAGTVENGRTLVPAGPLTAAVIDRSQDPGGKADAVVFASGSWSVQRTVPLPLDPSLAAGGDGRLCTAHTSDVASTLAVTALDGKGSSATVQIPALKGEALSCAAGKPVVGGSPLANTSTTPDSPGLNYSSVPGAEVVTAAGGRVDRIVATSTAITAAVAHPDHVDLVELDRSTRRETRRIAVTGWGQVNGMRHVAAGWVLTAGDKGVVVNIATGGVSAFDIPGELLDAD